MLRNLYFHSHFNSGKTVHIDLVRGVTRFFELLCQINLEISILHISARKCQHKTSIVKHQSKMDFEEKD